MKFFMSVAVYLFNSIQFTFNHFISIQKINRNEYEMQKTDDTVHGMAIFRLWLCSVCVCVCKEMH